MAHEHTEYAAASLPALIDDIFLMILDHLEPAHLAPLLPCCKLLHARALRVLFGTGVRRDRALLWACRRGCLPAVRRAVAFGANVVAPAYMVTVRTAAAAPQIMLRTSALRVAAQTGSLATLRLLMELGATLDMPRTLPQKVIRPTRRFQASSLVFQKNRNIYRCFLLFFNSDLASYGGGSFQGASYAHICLQHAFSGSKVPSVDAVRLLVSYDGPGGGASVRRLQASKKKKACPLARAILGRQRELDELLLAHGADIHGMPYWTEDLLIKAADIPIYAAARTMAHDGVDLVRRCIALGADVYDDGNIVYTCKRKPNTSNRWGATTFEARTPLPVYLHVASIENWDEEQVLRPTVGIQFWLAQGMTIDDGRIGRDCPQPDIGSSASLPSMIAMLLDKWGADFLANDECNRVIGLLAEPGLSDQHLSLLDRLSYPRKDKACERWEGHSPFTTPEDSNLLTMGCLRFD